MDPSVLTIHDGVTLFILFEHFIMMSEQLMIDSAVSHELGNIKIR